MSLWDGIMRLHQAQQNKDMMADGIHLGTKAPLCTVVTEY